jgi:hypothetical protein
VINATIACLQRLSTATNPEIVEWACPVPYFGDPKRAAVATVGINPSNKEFVGDDHEPLVGLQQRLPSRHALGLVHWTDAGPREVRAIDDACRRYFDGNSYDRWFGVLEDVLSLSGSTYYGLGADACHLDLVPFATSRKWGQLPTTVRAALSQDSADLFGRLLADSAVESLILNGRSVVETFESIGDLQLIRATRPEWSLPRAIGEDVAGVAYLGTIDVFGGYDLGRSIKVVGFNHNLQSSYGVTTSVKRTIAEWVAGERSR